MKNVLLVICFFLLTLNLIYAVENVDVIKLKDGTILKGEILETNNDFVIIKTSLGEIKIEKENIKITPVTIYLKDDNIIKGNLIKRNETSVNVETSLGSFEIELDNIRKMVEEIDSSVSQNTNSTTNTQNDTELGIKAIGSAFLYQQRQKKISTALGFQALGAGLLYSEKYTMGTIMLLAENGLLISGAFVDDPEIVPYLWISGIALKAVNTFFTIKSVNDYNNKLADEMGISNGINSKEIRLKTRKGYIYFATNSGIGFDKTSSAFLIGALSGYGNSKFGRIGINFSHILNKRITDLTFEYEKPLSISNNLKFSPKFGYGYSYNRFVCDYGTEGFGFILGSTFEFNINKFFMVQVGYNLFIGKGDEQIISLNHNMLLCSLYFKF